ncbi:MAG: fatty acyl-AMP ligase [Alphaproteobacteria bacterium]|nr:fatty acyl-AMP ligase [Alphaproteobacteria bacterium]
MCDGQAGGGPVPTPRSNRHMTQRLAQFDSLAAGLDYAAQGVTGFNFYSPRGALQHVMPYAELRRAALGTARKLLSLGLFRGDRVAVVAETGPEFVTVFFACQYAGLIPCPMPYSMHIGGRDAYVARIAGMLRAARACTVIGPEELLGHIRDAGLRAGVTRVMTHAELGDLPEAATKLEPFGPDEDAYIQYSSGSTSDPKGVLISQRAIIANAQGILRHGLKLTPDDRAFSWLPLYHDMGLVGFCLSPMLGQVTVDFLATTAFARRPALWLKLMSDNKSTITFSPSFGYDLAARRINGDAPSLDLTRLRVAGIGGDMVRADVLHLFAETLGVAGFDACAFLPSYGMAETTLAISFADRDAPVRIDSIDRVALKAEAVARPAEAGAAARSFVVCGRPLPDSEVEIRSEDGAVLGARAVGRIFVKSPGLMTGYYENPSATEAAVGRDGFLDTGDMGYWLDGEIVITGRAKDLILHNGRNIWPQDIEWAAEHLPPLRDGDVAAFAVEGPDGDDKVVVLVQCRLQDEAAIDGLRREVAAAVHQSAGVECQVVMIPPKSLPFTSSGKLSRTGARQRYLSGEIAELQPSVFLQAAQ